MSAQSIFDAAFHTARSPRSQPYKEGALGCLQWRIEGKVLNCPYSMGTVEADAFWSGVNEGNSLAYRTQEVAT